MSAFADQRTRPSEYFAESFSRLWSRARAYGHRAERPSVLSWGFVDSFRAPVAGCSCFGDSPRPVFHKGEANHAFRIAGQSVFPRRPRPAADPQPHVRPGRRADVRAGRGGLGAKLARPRSGRRPRGTPKQRNGILGAVATRNGNHPPERGAEGHGERSASSRGTPTTRSRRPGARGEKHKFHRVTYAGYRAPARAGSRGAAPRLARWCDTVGLVDALDLGGERRSWHEIRAILKSGKIGKGLLTARSKR